MFTDISQGEFIQVRWRPAEGDGAQVFRVRRIGAGITALGAIRLPKEDGGIDLEVRIETDPNWLVRSVNIQTSDGRELTLAHDGAGSWLKNGAPALHLAGCMDIDLSASPITNTLPVRRLPWRENQGRAFMMAYIKAPDLQVFKDGQRYICTGPRRFRFEELDGSFSDDITFDEHGLIAEYPKLFHRV